jgi:hopene-associated glycosyltransferase HpnB
VVAVVPARDEAEVIADSLASLLAQSHEALSLVVVDDASTDGTAAIARGLAARSSRDCEIVTLSTSPDGWSGKVNALRAGTDEALRRWPDLDWLLFTDADIEHRPDSVRALIARAACDDRQLVSVMARLRAESFWERLIVPPFVWFFQLLYPFRKIAAPSSSVAAAAGGCVLLRPEALERAGGLGAIRDALIDDVALGRAVADAGGRIWLGLDQGIVSLRSYRTLRSLWRMIARSAFVQLRYRWDWLLGVVAGMLVLFVSPPLLVAAGLVLAKSGEVWPGAAVIAASALSWGLQARALAPSVRHHRVPLRWSWTLPLSSFLYLLMTVSSALSHRRGRSSVWKGRVYEGR